MFFYQIFLLQKHIQLKPDVQNVLRLKGQTLDKMYLDSIIVVYVIYLTGLYLS